MRSPETAVRAIICIDRACFIPVLDINIRPYKMIRANLRRQSEIVHASSSTKSAFIEHRTTSANILSVVRTGHLKGPFDLV